MNRLMFVSFFEGDALPTPLFSLAVRSPIMGFESLYSSDQG